MAKTNTQPWPEPAPKNATSSAADLPRAAAASKPSGDVREGSNNESDPAQLVSHGAENRELIVGVLRGLKAAQGQIVSPYPQNRSSSDGAAYAAHSAIARPAQGHEGKVAAANVMLDVTSPPPDLPSTTIKDAKPLKELEGQPDDLGALVRAARQKQEQRAAQVSAPTVEIERVVERRRKRERALQILRSIGLALLGMIALAAPFVWYVWTRTATVERAARTATPSILPAAPPKPSVEAPTDSSARPEASDIVAPTARASSAQVRATAHPARSASSPRAVVSSETKPTPSEPKPATSGSSIPYMRFLPEDR